MKRKGRRSHFHSKEKKGQKRTTAQKTSSSFFLRGGRSIKGRRKKERKRKVEEEEEGKQQVWGTTSSFLTTPSVCPRKSYQSSCFVWIRLEFWSLVTGLWWILGSKDTVYFYFFWGESLSLDGTFLSASPFPVGFIFLIRFPCVRVSVSIFLLLYFCFFHLDCMLLLDFEIMVHRFAMSRLVLTFFPSRVITHMVRGAFLVDRSCFFRGLQMSIWISGFLPADL